MKRLIISIITALFIGTGCESFYQDNNNELDSAELQALSDGLVYDLGLNKSSTGDLNDALRRHGGGGRSKTPGFLWNVAVELQQSLSDEEKSVLFDRIEDLDYFGSNFRQKIDRKRGGNARAGLKAIQNILTDDQISDFDEILQMHIGSVKVIREKMNDGTFTKAEARAEMETLRDAFKVEIEALLSEEQLDQLEQMRATHLVRQEQFQEEQEARKAVAKQAMVEALSLTGEQITGFEIIHEETKTAITALKNQLKNGEVDRESFRETAKLIFYTRNEKLENLLTDSQMEIMKIHKALELRMQKHLRDGMGRNGRRSGSAGQFRGPRPGNG